ncbi:hypothetical protein B0G71_2572 [Paraburkholderia sp. BL27I4N3]|uniref:hypothetical protein n=1 Tax=Paraburkholderia sp. BL27I4N3 TaxID=1938805 RepID=UPI000E243C53|nr:hypothetical protein [Paraburkholderia sp. BL27I4N3]REE19475.1 hypothetical protein B0G71_2572 [Paraburkholderia sp. BL27I4N3]
MSRDHREKREPIATMLARQRADLDRVWNEAKRRRSGAAVLRDPDQLRRIREAREAEATFTLDLNE